MIYKYLKNLWVKKHLFVVVVFLYFSIVGNCQIEAKPSFFEKADTLNKTRLTYSSIVAVVSYTGISVGLYNLWYKQYEQESFHLFNDWHEWRKMDKFGHTYSAYLQTAAGYELARWTGMKENSSLWAGIATGMISQTTIEIMDGFTSKWGFSIPDMVFNIGGVTLFAAQQKAWGEQRITLKVNSWPIQYDAQPIYSVDGMATSSPFLRAQELYGSGYFTRFFKDYNAQILWASFNLKSFAPNLNIPSWLNIAVGYSAENMYGGFENSWVENGHLFALDAKEYPRYSQFYLSPDISLRKIKTNSHFLNSIFLVLDSFKAPLPSIELNTQGEIHFHLFR